MKKQLLKGSLIYLLGFGLFFLFRLIYGFIYYPVLNQEQQYDRMMNQFIESENVYSARNYASKKYVEKSVEMDQKYEKTALVKAKSSDFSPDEQAIRRIISGHNALIQHEESSGLKGRRLLYLIIGVPPNQFDSFIGRIKTIGQLTSLQIQKIDKTNEYKELKAKQASLIKTRDSLLELKKLNAKVTELIGLETKILEIENQIQQLGVNLGEFDEENEFCTVNFSLSEMQVSVSNIPFIHRLKVSLEWTIKYYFAFTLLLFLGLLTVFIILLIVSRFKLIQKVYQQFNKDR